jgi:hypothetical protein
LWVIYKLVSPISFFEGFVVLVAGCLLVAFFSDLEVGPWVLCKAKKDFALAPEVKHKRALNFQYLDKPGIMSQMLSDKRATRGLRMAELVGEAADQDDAFWGHSTWEEGQDSEDEEFSDVEIKPDEFDSDFNDTESESDSDDDSEEEKQRGSERKAKAKANAAGSRYKEPGGPARSKAAALSRGAGEGESGSGDADAEVGMEVADEGDEGAETVTPRKPKLKRASSNISLGSLDSSNTPRSVRASTKVKTEIGEFHRSKQAVESETKRKARPLTIQTRPMYTQKELLLDALVTEEANLAWLSGQKLDNERRAESDKPAKKAKLGGYVRRLSKRGTYDTITFTNTDTMPSVFNLRAPEPKVKIRCCITGQAAKYFDPLTQQGYANAEAFKVLRARHGVSRDAR